MRSGTPRAVASNASAFERSSRKACRFVGSRSAATSAPPRCATGCSGTSSRPSRHAMRGATTIDRGSLLRECARHGWSSFVRVGAAGHYRCARCNTEAVSDRRRRVKEILVAEAGGRCVVCGVDAYVGALQFHHRDPATKAFEVSRQGITRSLDRLRLEARKCVLLCANCHAMVEAGLLLPPAGGHVG